MDVESITSNMTLANESTSEADTKLLADLEGAAVVGEDVGGGRKEWRGFQENNFMTWNEGNEVRQNL